jgi:SAM-dependent methyltransferase
MGWPVLQFPEKSELGAGRTVAALDATSPVMGLAPSLDVFDNFPRGDGERGSFVLALAKALGSVERVADIGGGANPLLDEARLQANGIECTLLDISAAELKKAPAYYKQILVDMTTSPEDFCERVGRERFDVMFSNDFLEHIRNPARVHKNIFDALRPGGLAIHFYPSPMCIPLIVNRLLPDWLTRALLRIAQPHRDIDGRQGKFPAFYAMCGAPSKDLRLKYEQLGFDVIRHTGYIGHDYYQRFPVAREIELALRPMLCYAGIPMISRTILVLQKHVEMSTEAFMQSSGVRRGANNCEEP